MIKAQQSSRILLSFAFTYPPAKFAKCKIFFHKELTGETITEIFFLFFLFGEYYGNLYLIGSGHASMRW